MDSDLDSDYSQLSKHMTYDDPCKLKLIGVFKKWFKNTEPVTQAGKREPRLLTVCHLTPRTPSPSSPVRWLTRQPHGTEKDNIYSRQKASVWLPETWQAKEFEKTLIKCTLMYLKEEICSHDNHFKIYSFKTISQPILRQMKTLVLLFSLHF